MQDKAYCHTCRYDFMAVNGEFYVVPPEHAEKWGCGRMMRIEQAEKAFIAVRDELYLTEQIQAFNFSYKKPCKFYYEHSKEEAIAILLEEVKSINTQHKEATT